MVEQLLLLFQALFLVLLYLFIWRVVRTASRDLRLPQESFFLAPSQAHGGQVAPPVPRGRLVIEASPSFEPGRSFELGVSPVTIGRSGENAIPLPQDEYASSQHARLEPLRNGVWLVDLGSTNGTYVNGRQVSGREQLHDGDVVHIGETDLRVEWSRQ
jgi:pSer/pThr/pTyr-binding forkhead associated (FHA) protein